MRNQQTGQSTVIVRDNLAVEPKIGSQSHNKQTVNLGTNPFMDSIETHNSVSVNEFEDWFQRPEEHSPQMSNHIHSREFIRGSPERLRAQSSERSNVKLSAPFTRKNLKNLLNRKEKLTKNDTNSQDSDFTLQDSVTDENPNVEIKVKKLNTNHSESKLDSIKKNIAAQSRCMQQNSQAFLPQDAISNGSIQINNLLKQTQQGQSFSQQTATPPFVLIPFQDQFYNQNNRLPDQEFQKQVDSYIPLPGRNGIGQFPSYQLSQNNQNSSIHSTYFEDHQNNPYQQNNSSFFHPQNNSIQIPQYMPEYSNSASSQLLRISTNSTIQIPDNSPQTIPMVLHVEDYSKQLRIPNESIRSKSTGIRGSKINSNPARALKDLRMIQQQSQGLFNKANNSCNTTMEQVWQKQSLSENIKSVVTDKQNQLNTRQQLKIAPAQFQRNDPNYIKIKNNSQHFPSNMANPASFSWNPNQIDSSSNFIKNELTKKNQESSQINKLNPVISNIPQFEEIRNAQQQNTQKNSNNLNISNQYIEQRLNLDNSSFNRESIRTQSQTQPLYQSSFIRSSSQVQLSVPAASTNLNQINSIQQYKNIQNTQQKQLQQSPQELPKSISSQNYPMKLEKQYCQQQQIYIPLQYQLQNQVQYDKSCVIDQDSFNQSRVGMKMPEEKEKQFQVADSALKSVRIYSTENSPQINVNRTPSSLLSHLNAKISPPLNSNIRNIGSKLQDPPSTAASFSAENSAATMKELPKTNSAGKPSYPLVLAQSKNSTDHPLYVPQVDDILKQFKVNKPQFDQYTSKTNVSKKNQIIAVKLHSNGSPPQGFISKYIK